MKRTGVVDRVRDGKAVILVGRSEYIIDAADKASWLNEGAWLTVEFRGNEIVSLTLDEEKTQNAEKRIGQKHERLKENQKSKFKKK